MPDLADDKQLASSYVPTQLYESWRADAEALDVSLSQYIVKMVEAGRKQLDTDSMAVQSMQELREERDNLRREVQRERVRVEELEQQLDRTARADVVGFIEENPGVSAPEVIQHVADSVPGRTVGLLDTLEGEQIEESDGVYRPLENEQGDLMSDDQVGDGR